MTLRPQMAQAAQEIYDDWAQDVEGLDVMVGGGGICDQITQAIAGVIVESGVADITEGGQEGDDHAWTVAYNDQEAYAVDIPCRVYEQGGGYSWAKIPDVKFTPDHIQLFPIDRKDIDPEGY